MTFLGGTTTFYGGGQTANPPNVLTHLSGMPQSVYRVPLGTISIDNATSEAYMMVSNVGNVSTWVSITGQASGDVQSVTGNSGGPVPPTAGNLNLLGNGIITVTGNPGTSTLTISSTSSAAFVWNVASVSPTAMVSNNGYYSATGAPIVFSLPLVAVFGEVIEVAGGTSTSWSITQAAGQSIVVGPTTTTVGVGGSLASTNNRDCVRLLCIEDNTTFEAISWTGNLTAT